MRKKIWGIALLVLAALGFTVGGVAAWRGSAGPNPYAGSATAAPMVNSTLDGYYADLSQEEIDGLLWIIEEEKLARDVYLTLYDLWGLQVFNNIANSEQMHMNAVLSLIEKYNLTAPDTLDQVGVFQDEELQALYDQLIETGSQSEVDALKVGALIEEVDIEDLEERIAQTDNEDIKTVYSNLMAGSENHLRAFTSQLEALGVSYTAQVLPQEQVDEILASTGSHGMGGMGMAMGTMGARHGGAQEQAGILDGITNTLRNAWAWMRGFAHRIGMPI
ncbi:DUF2202 domain-containing protein [Thermococcus sp. M36]|uniref:DUF2202 domain-containing protein n=1 Tax=Thermococcus sp. M36 TaxID=1638261 RepID=UPI00143B1D04|nr:DUF2202 domain-containing protein [Thermococcus sp. M36]NJE06470.1 DUF2202 domain-containing protein [Thermococcus sp. M36]